MKVTENKFQLGVEMPEMLDDWDQRYSNKNDKNHTISMLLQSGG